MQQVSELHQQVVNINFLNHHSLHCICNWKTHDRNDKTKQQNSARHTCINTFASNHQMSALLRRQPSPRRSIRVESRRRCGDRIRVNIEARKSATRCPQQPPGTFCIPLFAQRVVGFAYPRRTNDSTLPINKNNVTIWRRRTSRSRINSTPVRQNSAHGRVSGYSCGIPKPANSSGERARAGVSDMGNHIGFVCEWWIR